MLFLLLQAALAGEPLRFDAAVAQAVGGSPTAGVIAGQRQQQLGEARGQGSPLANPTAEWERVGSEDELRLRLPVDLAGQPFARAAVGRALAEAARARAEGGEAALAATAAHAYLDLVASEQRAARADRAAALARGASEAAAALLNAGELAPVDALIARADAARLQSEAALAAQDRLASRLGLEVLLGRPPVGEVLTAGWPTLAAPRTVAVSTLAEVRTAEAEARAARAGLDLARMDQVPTPELVGGWSEGSGSIVGIQLEIPIFAPGFAAVREARGARQVAEHQAEATRLTAEAERRRLTAELAAAESAWRLTDLPDLDSALDQVAAAWTRGEYAYAEYSARMGALLSALNAADEAHLRLERATVALFAWAELLPHEVRP